MIVLTSGANSTSGDMRQIMKTPAVTMVAAWISADTGVGPSIASGSQVCRNNCADLPMAPMNSNSTMISVASKLQLRNCRLTPERRDASAKMSSSMMLSVR